MFIAICFESTSSLGAEPPRPTVACHAGAIGRVLPVVGVFQSRVGGLVPQARPIAAQIRRNNKTVLTFNSIGTRDGSIQIDGRGGELSFRKTVRQNGTFTL